MTRQITLGLVALISAGLMAVASCASPVAFGPDSGGEDSSSDDVAPNDSSIHADVTSDVADAATLDATDTGTAQDASLDTWDGNTSRRVFVTSYDFVGGIFGGASLASADSKCVAASNAANLGGTWVAWASATTADMTTRLDQNGGPFVRLDGVVVATNWTELVSGTLENPINLTETMQTVSKNVWTGTASDGHTSGSVCNGSICTCSADAGTCYTCADWSSNGVLGTIGETSATTSEWTDNGRGNCAASLQKSDTGGLYCFEQAP